MDVILRTSFECYSHLLHLDCWEEINNYNYQKKTDQKPVSYQETKMQLLQ